MQAKSLRTGLIALILLVSAIFLYFFISRIPSCNVAYIKLHGDLVDYIPPTASTTIEYYVPTSTPAMPAIVDQTGSDGVVRAIHNAVNNPNIMAIIMEVDSEGGNLNSGEEIEQALRQVKKPTIAYIREYGNSSAYMAATGANEIFAEYLSEVGSIGVTESYTDQSKWDAAHGITFNQLSVGKYKDAFNPDKPLTNVERAMIMEQLEIGDQRFIQIVATNRHMSIASTTALADGAPRVGSVALQDGLIDAIGGIDQISTYLKSKIGGRVIICGVDN